MADRNLGIAVGLFGLALLVAPLFVVAFAGKSDTPCGRGPFGAPSYHCD